MRATHSSVRSRICSALHSCARTLAQLRISSIDIEAATDPHPSLADASDTFSRKREKGRASSILLVCSAFCLLGCAPARADEVADFYRGKMVHIIVGYDRGGGYDTMAHLIAETLGNYIPGHPLVIVQNMVGAGSMRAASYVAGGAPQDGTIIAATGPAPLFVPFIPPGADTYTLDPQRLNWLPSPASETSVIAVWHTADVKSIDDARRFELPVAANSINGQASFYARLLNEVLGTKFKPILGYQNGTSESLIAMERGEVLAHPSIPLTSLKSERPQWLQDGSVRLIAQYGRAPAEDLPDVPFVDNLLSGENKQVFDIATAPQMIGRPISWDRMYHLSASPRCAKPFSTRSTTLAFASKLAPANSRSTRIR